MYKSISKICAFAIALCLASAPVSILGAGNVSDFLVFNGSSSVSDTVKNNLSLNTTFTDGCVFCKYDTGFDTYFFMCDLDTMYSENGVNGWKYYSNYNASGTRIANCHEYDGDASSRNYDFGNISNNVTAQYVIGYNGNTFIICYTSASLTSGRSLESICQNSTTNDSWPSRLPAKRPDLKYCVVYPPSIEYIPADYEEVNLPFYSLDVDNFYDWIINNNKLVELPVYITQSKLKSFLTFYKRFGSSNKMFLSKVVDWFNTMNIASQSSSNRSALKYAIDKLYQEYINYRSGTHAYWPNATKLQERTDIDTKTDNSDLTLVTDDSNDTLDISILRDILRGVIAVSNNVNQGTANLIQKLEQLDFTVNLVNGGGTVGTDLSELYIYDPSSFDDDLQQFYSDVEEVQSVPQGYIDTINQNGLMPENMLQDKSSLTVNVPTITGFTVGGNGNTYSTQTGSYVLKSSDYPWLDSAVQKIKRFASILLIIGYLVHLRYRIPELVRGE